MLSAPSPPLHTHKHITGTASHWQEDLFRTNMFQYGRVVLGRPASGRTLEAERSTLTAYAGPAGAHGKGAVISGIDVHSIAFA